MSSVILSYTSKTCLTPSNNRSSNCKICKINWTKTNPLPCKQPAIRFSHNSNNKEVVITHPLLMWYHKFQDSLLLNNSSSLSLDTIPLLWITMQDPQPSNNRILLHQDYQTETRYHQVWQQYSEEVQVLVLNKSSHNMVPWDTKLRIKNQIITINSNNSNNSCNLTDHLVHNNNRIIFNRDLRSSSNSKIL